MDFCDDFSNINKDRNSKKCRLEGGNRAKNLHEINFPEDTSRRTLDTSGKYL